MSVFIPVSLPISVENVAELITTRTADGGVIKTAGYNTPGDGGGNSYFYRSSGRSLQVDSNSLSIIRGGFLIAGTGTDDYYEACDKTVINARQYGAVDGRLVDATDIFFNMAADCVDYFVAEGDGSVQTAKIYVPHGDYRLRYWTLPAQATVVGDGIEGTYLIAAPDAGTCDFTAVGSTDLFTTNNFPWLIGRRVNFSGNSLPTGITEGKQYYVVYTTLSAFYDYQPTVSFKVSEVPGGAPINITSDGSGLAIHGSFISDRGNAAKISWTGITLWGNIKSMVDGSVLPDSDADYQSPNVTSVFDFGVTANKGGVSVDPWGTGAYMSDINVYYWRHSIGFDIVNNISYQNKVWAEHCGQNFRIRGNGWGVNTAYATGNRGVAFQYDHSLPFEVDYVTSPYEIFGEEPVPLVDAPVYFIGDDLPAGITQQKPYYVRTSDLLTAFTVDTGAETIESASHGLDNGYRLYFNGSSLPGGLSSQTKCFVINKTDDDFQVSLNKNGSPINITSAGSGSMYYYRQSFQICETEAGLPVDLTDNGTGTMRYSVYSTAAVDVQGGCMVTDLEIEAPFGYDSLIVDGSDQLQCTFTGVYWSLDNAANSFTAVGATDVFTLGSAVTGYTTITLADGLEVYLIGDSLPTGTYANRRYWVRDLSGSTFKIAATEGGAAFNITGNGSGTIAITPKPDNLIRWKKSAGSITNPRVSPGARGYTAYGMFASSDGTVQTQEQVESVGLSRTRHKGPLLADSLVLPNLGGYAVLTAEVNGTIGAARVLLNNWYADFNGIDTQILMGSTIALTKPGEYTYSFKCSVRTVNTILAGHTVSNDSYLGFFVDATHMRHNSYNNSGVNYVEAVLPTACNDGDLHHYVLRRMPGNVWSIWQDGTLCTDAETGTLAQNYGWVNLIGRRGAAPEAWFDGQVDFFRAWDRGLTDDEVTAEFAGTIAAGALLDYEFTDAAGTQVKDFGSGNNVGTLSAADTAAVWVTETPLAIASTRNKVVIDTTATDVAAIADNNRTRIAELEAVLIAAGLMDGPTLPTNLIGVSDDFSNAAWTKVEATISTNVASSPAGGTYADRITNNTVNLDHRVTKAISGITSGQSYTFSVYLKAETMDWATLYETGGSGYGRQFDLTNGVTGNVYLNAPVDSAIENVGGGWYRCSITTVASATTLTYHVYCHLAEDALVYVGASETLLVDAAQLELGVSATTYVRVTP